MQRLLFYWGLLVVALLWSVFISACITTRSELASEGGAGIEAFSRKRT